MVNLRRWFKHVFIPPWLWRRAFPGRLLTAIEQAITRSELQHRGELRFAVENALAPRWVWRGLSGQQRAGEIFSTLRVWDTEENSGVLIYVLLADREVHIVADRGIARCVPQSSWDSIADSMQTAFKSKQFEAGALEGIQQITALLASHFPADGLNPNELANKPVIIRH